MILYEQRTALKIAFYHGPEHLSTIIPLFKWPPTKWRRGEFHIRYNIIKVK